MEVDELCLAGGRVRSDHVRDFLDPSTDPELVSGGTSLGMVKLPSRSFSLELALEAMSVLKLSLEPTPESLRLCLELGLDVWV